MGVGIVGAILVRDGLKEGYRIAIQGKKGLAIRNCGVYAQGKYRGEQPGTTMPDNQTRRESTTTP